MTSKETIQTGPILKVLVANVPCTQGEGKLKCKCGAMLRYTTHGNENADEDDPFRFCPKCGWDESKK